MTTLTPEQVWAIRDEIGTSQPPTDADLQVMYDHFGGTVGVVRSVLRRRLATMLAQPSAFAIPGDYSQSTTTNIVQLEKKLARMAGLPDDSDDLSAIDSTGGTGMVYVLERTGDPAR